MAQITESLRIHGQRHQGTDLGGVLQWAALHIDNQDEALAELREAHAEEEAERPARKERASRAVVVERDDGEHRDLPMDYPVKTVFAGGVNPWTGGVA